MAITIDSRESKEVAMSSFRYNSNAVPIIPSNRYNAGLHTIGSYDYSTCLQDRLSKCSVIDRCSDAIISRLGDHL